MAAPPIDLDDILDSALDEYEKDEQASQSQSVVAVSPSPAAVPVAPTVAPAAPASTSNATTDPQSAADILNDPNRFAAELKNMMDELARSGDLPSGPEAEPMMKSFEQLIQGLQNLPPSSADPALPAAAASATASSASASASSSSSSSSAAAAPVENALDQMFQAVAEGAKSAKQNSSAGSDDPFGDPAQFAEMLKLLSQNPNGGDMGDMSQLDAMFKAMMQGAGSGGGDQGNLDKMMADMVSQMGSLLNKSVMKEPIVAVTSKYPAWLAANMDKVTAEEYARYQQQYDCFQRLCAEFDKPGDDMAPVMALMQEMQAYGNPPQDILNEVMPGMPPMDAFNPAAAFGGAFGAPPAGAAGAAGALSAGMPPIPPELADLDPQKLQEACKMQ